MTEQTIRKCPRCDAAAILNEQGAVSRTTRDEGAPVLICSRCGLRESLYGRDPADQVSMIDWPLTIDSLLIEERALLEIERDSEVLMVSADELEGAE